MEATAQARADSIAHLLKTASKHGPGHSTLDLELAAISYRHADAAWRLATQRNRRTLIFGGDRQ